MKEERTKKDIDKNFFREMSYELAGDIGAIDNEDMVHNKKLISEKNKKRKGLDNNKK